MAERTITRSVQRAKSAIIWTRRVEGGLPRCLPTPPYVRFRTTAIVSEKMGSQKGNPFLPFKSLKDALGALEPTDRFRPRVFDAPYR